MGRKQLARLSVFVVIGGFTQDADATEIALCAKQTPHGPVITERRPSSETTWPVESGEAVLGGRFDGEVLWHRHHENAIYTTTGISMPEQLVLASTYFNPPMQIEATPLEGDGTEDWVHPGTEFFVDVSRNAGVIAALDYVSDDSTITVMEFGSGSSTPLWSYEIHPCRPLTGDGWAQGKGVQVSDDGSTIAVIVNMHTREGLNGRLHVFNPGSGAPAIVYDLPDGTASALSVTPPGAYIAIYAWPNIYVYDRYGESLRWSGQAGSGNDALAISGDGTWLAWGWWTFYLREWNGSTYELKWTDGTNGTYLVGECALTSDESTLAIAWYRNVTVDENIVRLYELPSLDLRWEYSYENLRTRRSAGSPTDESIRNPTDVASEVVFSPDGVHLAISSWGGHFPEIHVFDALSPDPVMTLDTPGTMFDIDIVDSPQGDVFVSACGKNVHAGQAGRGGDLYSIRVPGESSGVPGLASAPSGPFVYGHPNPFHSTTTIRLWIPDGVPACLTVHDVSGRRIATLLEDRGPFGSGSVVWTGRDDDGNPLPSGVYLLRLSSGGDATVHRVILLK